MVPVRRSSPITAFATLLVLASCSSGTEPRVGGQASLVVTANVSATSVALVVVEVTAPDIGTPLIFNVPITGGVASGTITIPAGSDRTITIRAFDAGGVQTHNGSVTIDVPAGTNPTVSLVLTPLHGDVPIEATLGSIAVAVTPATSTLSLAGASRTVQLSATITNAQGNTVIGTVSWATGDPSVASVSETGLVTAVGQGSTNVVATFQGAAGAAAITVTP